MTQASSLPRNNKDLIFLALLFGAGLVFFELWMATTNHDNSRDQHLGGAVAYAKGRIDLLRPMLPGFNANGTPTPLEFPIWQALTAIFMKCLGIWYGWGNVVSLAFFFSSLWVLFDLCRRMGSARTGWWAILFSLVQPLSIICGGQAGGDSTAWAFAMWFIYFSHRMMSEGKWRWWPWAVAAGGLSAATKAPFFMTAGLTAFFWLWLRHRASRRAWVLLISAGAMATLFFLAWNFHCHRVYAEAEFPTINMDPLNGKSGINGWYFGTLADRLNPRNLLSYGWHTATAVLGGLAFVVLPLISIRFKQSAEAWLWMLAAALTTLVFMPLIGHMHYLFIFGPATAWLCAIAATEIEPGIWNLLRASACARAGILLVTFAASLAGMLVTVHINMLFDPYQAEIGELIKQHTSPDEKIVVWGTNWGDPFLRADRQGLTGALSLDGTGWFNDARNLKRLKQLGYKKIVLVNPPYFVVALTYVNGKHGEKIVDLHQALPAVAKNWPVVFDTSEMLIVQIPD